MYDEFERAVTGRPARAGMSVLGWLVAGFGFLALVGVVGAGFAIARAVDKAKDVAWNVAHELDADRAGAALAQLDAHTAMVLSLQPEEGLAYLEDLSSGDPAEAFVARMGDGALEPFRELRDLGRLTEPAAGPGGIEVKRDVRVHLDRAGDGGSLTIDADGERVRFDLVKTGSGGSLSITSADGDVRFDVSGGEDGGHLVIRSDEASLRLGVGGDAEGIPGWVPRFEGIPSEPEPVLSLESDAGTLGAVAWEGSASPAEVLAFYRAELEAAGYVLQDQVRRTAEGHDEGSFWARHEDGRRVVFVVARAEAGRTGVLLGYGDER